MPASTVVEVEVVTGPVVVDDVVVGRRDLVSDDPDAQPAASATVTSAADAGRSRRRARADARTGGMDERFYPGGGGGPGR
jgi:hypothetical protein